MSDEKLGYKSNETGQDVEGGPGELHQRRSSIAIGEATDIYGDAETARGK